MIYRTIGLMSGSSLDGLDIAYCIIEESGGNWTYEIPVAECVPFNAELKNSLEQVTSLSSKEFMLLDAQFGRWMGDAVNAFIEKNALQFKIALIASHGHTAFHLPAQGTSVQIGCGATIAAVTQLPVVNNLRQMDVALGGQGAPIVPIAEQLFFPDYKMFLNIGGISNITFYHQGKYMAYDICSANRVLNTLCKPLQVPYDKDGLLAKAGTVHQALLEALSALDYYTLNAPKSLANEFGTELVLPLIAKFNLSAKDNLATYTQHIAMQISNAIAEAAGDTYKEILITGGGALNNFLVESIDKLLDAKGIKLIVPDEHLVQYKESLAMALIGVLRWREENNVLHTATGAIRSSVGGAMYLGTDC
jgi:anhydro-N-acetylmuramic acid kinase